MAAETERPARGRGPFRRRTSPRLSWSDRPGSLPLVIAHARGADHVQVAPGVVVIRSASQIVHQVCDGRLDLGNSEADVRERYPSLPAVNPTELHPVDESVVPEKAD